MTIRYKNIEFDKVSELLEYQKLTENVNYDKNVKTININSNSFKRITVKNKKYTKWTEKDIKYLKDNYKTMNNKTLSKKLKRTYYSINKMMTVLKLKR